MLQSFDEFNSNDKVEEKRMFTLSEIRKNAISTLKNLGIMFPSEDDIKDMIAKLKAFINDHQVGTIQENNDNLDKAYKAASKFGIALDPNQSFQALLFEKTRLQIVEDIILNSDKFEGEAYEKAVDKLSQLMTDKDCQDYMDGIVEVYQETANEDALLSHAVEMANDYIEEKFKS